MPATGSWCSPALIRTEHLISTRANATDKSHRARIAVVVNAAAGSGGDAPLEELRAALPDARHHDIWMIFIGNCAYEPPGLAPSARSSLHDGCFDVRYVDTASSKSRLRVLAALAIGRAAHTKAFKRELVRSLEIHALDGPLRLARDGETFDGGTFVRVVKHAGTLSVYARSDPFA